MSDYWCPIYFAQSYIPTHDPEHFAKSLWKSLVVAYPEGTEIEMPKALIPEEGFFLFEVKLPIGEEWDTSDDTVIPEPYARLFAEIPFEGLPPAPIIREDGRGYWDIESLRDRYKEVSDMMPMDCSYIRFDISFTDRKSMIVVFALY